MKKMTTVVCLFALVFGSSFAMGQQSVPTVPCDPRDADCIHEASDISDESQDLALTDLQGQISCLKQAQVRFAEAAKLASATRRIAKLEEFRDSLPEDLIGQSDIQIMIDRAETATRTDLDRVLVDFQNAVSRRIVDLETRMAALEGRIKKAEEDVVAVRNRTYDAEDRLDTVENRLQWRAIELELGLTGIASNGVSGGGVGGGILVPLGQNGSYFLRATGWLGDAPNGFGWGGQLGIDWWLSPSWAFGFAALYAADEGTFKGIQTMTAGAGLDLRLRSDWFTASVTPFLGVAGQKPDQFRFGGGVAGFLGATF